MPEFSWNCSARRSRRACRRGAAEDLARLVGGRWRHWRRRACAASTARAGSRWRPRCDRRSPQASSTERGPRVGAPEQALAGFLRKHGATREQVRQEGDYWVLDKRLPAIDAGRR